MDIAEHALIVEKAQIFRADVARMRYCEKNLFFLIKERDRVETYNAEWEEILIELNTLLNSLAHTERMEPTCLALVARMSDFTPYVQTYRETIQAIRAGQITDPITANNRLRVYKHLARDTNKTAIAFAN
jgi:L-serine deaminase